ncbi:MAG TPA: GtrA family protein [Solirubrobacteraceae bacterium]|nr:GtrA family protein [Solirubrobacteraceae bacterium]
MSADEAVAESPIDAPRLRGRTRVRAGLRRPSNWLQLVQFAVVGASGYVVNLLVYTLCEHGLGATYPLAATAAFLVALTNNFVWNRMWTFRAREGHAGFQAARFFVVSLIAFGFNLIVLYTLVEGFGMNSVMGMGTVPAQAIAIALATPLNFIGNKLWSFRK